MKVLYIAPYRDGSGWSHSAISNILALDSVDVEVFPKALKLNNVNGEIPERLAELEARKNEKCDFVIINSLPHHYSWNGNYKKNIGYYFCETSHFSNCSWNEHINIMDEAWVPCLHNKIATFSSDVKVPVNIVPVACDPTKYQKKYKKLDIPHLEGKYVFYWIGEFSTRKHLTALIQAYHLEFKPDENVELVLKVSVPGVPPNKVYDFVSGVCNEVKEQLKLYKNKSTYLAETIVGQRLKEDEISSLHQMCDCYVAPSFGEGWNIPAFDAMGFGNMVIASDCTAHQDFLPSISLVSTEKKFVMGMKNSAFADMYVGNEEWYSINIKSLRYKMRGFYVNRNQPSVVACKKSNMERAYDFSYQNVGNSMKELLCQNYM